MSLYIVVRCCILLYIVVCLCILLYIVVCCMLLDVVVASYVHTSSYVYVRSCVNALSRSVRVVLQTKLEDLEYFCELLGIIINT